MPDTHRTDNRVMDAFLPRFLQAWASTGATGAAGVTGVTGAAHSSSASGAARQIAPGTEGVAVWSDLVERYAEPQRAYHTAQHLAECLTLFDGVRDQVGPPAAEIELALWFHDAVYDVHGSDNEARSAELAATALRAAGAREPSVEAVCRLVLATRHAAPPATPDECWLIDIDLAILGAEAARFDEYEAQIRREYGFVPADAFATRRRALLRAFLARSRLYATAHFHALLETRARANLQRSLERLDPQPVVDCGGVQGQPVRPPSG